MARLNMDQAEQTLIDLIRPVINGLSAKLKYLVTVYWPGLDGPRKVDESNVYVIVQSRIPSKETFAIPASSGDISHGELRTMLVLTEKRSDYRPCREAALDLIEILDRRRCGPTDDLIIHNTRWEDTEYRDGRRIFHLVTSYEFES